VLGKRHLYAVANLCQLILTIEFLEDERSEGRLVSNQLLSVLGQHLGMVPEEGAYSRDKISDLAYKPPPTLLTNAKVAKWGHICRTPWYYLAVAEKLPVYVSLDGHCHHPSCSVFVSYLSRFEASMGAC